MKQVNLVEIISIVFLLSFSAYAADDAARSQSKYVTVQEYNERIVAMQDQINRLEKILPENLQVINPSEKQTKLQAITRFFKAALIPSFCAAVGLYASCRYNKENAFTVISTICTIIGLYLGYRNNYETLRLSRASFILDKGVMAFKNLALIDTEKYDQLALLGVKAKKA